MSIGGAVRSFDDWLEGPASLISDSFSAKRRGRQTRVDIASDGASLALQTGRRGKNELVLPVGEVPESTSFAAAVKGRNLVLVVPEAWLIRRRIELPLEAADHLDGIIASRMSSLSPLPASETYSGHRIAEVDRAAKRLVVSVAIVAKSRLSRFFELFEHAQPRAIIVETPVSGSGGVVQLTGRAGVAKARQAVKRALAALLIVAVLAASGAVAWKNLAATQFEERRADLELRLEKARRALSEAAAPAIAATAPEQAALDIKNGAVSVVGALEDLAATLPLHAYATEIVVIDGNLRLTGKTNNVPDVLTALESSGRFAGSRLVGPATRSEDGNTSDFVLETRPLIRTGGGLH